MSKALLKIFEGLIGSEWGNEIRTILAKNKSENIHQSMNLILLVSLNNVLGRRQKLNTDEYLKYMTFACGIYNNRNSLSVNDRVAEQLCSLIYKFK